MSSGVPMMESKWQIGPDPEDVEIEAKIRKQDSFERSSERDVEKQMKARKL